MPYENLSEPMCFPKNLPDLVTLGDDSWHSPVTSFPCLPFPVMVGLCHGFTHINRNSRCTVVDN